MNTSDPIGSAIVEAISRYSSDLIALSHDIWDHPELAFQEFYTAEQCTQILTAAGFDVLTGIADLPTAFVAEIGNGSLVVAICAELDALPELVMPAATTKLPPPQWALGSRSHRPLTRRTCRC